jgi:uroporphyrinogen-III decarboxylase
LVRAALDKFTDSLCEYASFQVQSGAQVIQIFESWSHHMGEETFVAFAKV